MKIPSASVQFKDKIGLVLVTGTKDADFYLAKDGVISNVFHYQYEKIKFSDREDRSRRGSFVFDNSDEFDKIKKEERINFIKSFKDEIKKISAKQKFDLVYLFAPETIMGDLEKVLPAVVRNKIVKTYSGNYCKEGLLNILKKIKK